MSSCTSATNSSSESSLSLCAASTSKFITKPNTTEQTATVLQQEDDRLKAQVSSKTSLTSSTISSIDSSLSKYNGSLNKSCELSDCESPLSSFEAKSSSNHDSVNQETPSRLICRFYFKNGFCRYGRNCRYTHPVDVPVSSSKKPRSYVNRNRNNTQKLDNISIPVTTLENQQVIEINDDTRSDSNKLGSSTEICRFFSRQGFCRFGNACRYIHKISPQQSQEIPHAGNTGINKKRTSRKTTLSDLNNESEKLEENGNVESLECSESKNKDHNHDKKKTICRTFKKFGNCRFGNLCKFLHIDRKDKKLLDTSENVLGTNDSSSLNEVINHTLEENSKTENEGDNYGKPLICKRPVLLKDKKASDMTAADLSKLRQAEINQLKRRFPKFISSSIEESTVFQVEFSPTDPDWRFDVKSIQLNIHVPKDYPQKSLQVEISNPQGILPIKLTRYFNKTTSTWLKVQHEKNLADDTSELVFRPFLRWLDRSLEDIFISGLKMVKRDMEAEAAGIEFVTHEELEKNFNELDEQSKNKDTNSTEKQSLVSNDDPITPEYEESMPSFLDNASAQSILVDQTVDDRAMLETPKRGTEIKLRNLELLEGAASLTCRKLCITVQCGRCKMRSEIAATPHRNHKVVCERCHHQQKLTFRPQMLHPYSAVVGYLDLANCLVLDVPLLNCEFALQCLPCGRQNLLTAIEYGQRHTSWCLFCHSKMIVFVESAKLSQLQPNIEAVASVGQLLKLEKKEKRVKDPAVQEGKPLPENGICKHYKKSFRWLRFPCCGKCYPCDLCHDEKESDHDMKYATRMICGFCAKEQPYGNDRPCVLCSSNMTKKSGSHWEGGRGCRDKSKMSKDDKQKYAGCNKTIPKKVQPATKIEK